ncbi:MAG: UDP-N-acetylmuramate dehydrogenase, partial [Muribaculaceae bacterium]
YSHDPDVKLSAAWLIDNAGCKGFTQGGASLWPSQPLVIINTCGQATGEDVVALEKRIIQTVRNVFQVELSPEVIHI